MQQGNGAEAAHAFFKGEGIDLHVENKSAKKHQLLNSPSN